MNSPLSTPSQPVNLGELLVSNEDLADRLDMLAKLYAVDADTPTAMRLAASRLRKLGASSEKVAIVIDDGSLGGSVRVGTPLSARGPMLFINGDCRAEIDPGKEGLVFAKLMAFLSEHKCWAGESFAQCDGPQIGVMDFMCDILDNVLKAKVTYDE